ncbi:hypothetical protein Ancab_019576 [Ancistrocladus abbreviatus]
MERVSGKLLIIILLAFFLTTTLALHTTGGLNSRPTQQWQAPAAAPSITTSKVAAAPSTTASKVAAAPSTTAPNVAALVQKACQTAADTNFCISTLKSRPETQTVDLHGLAFLTLKLAKEHAGASSAFIADQLKDEEKLDADLDQAYNDCKDEYDDVMAQIEDSMQAFLAKNARDVKTFMSAAIAATRTCQQSVKTGGEATPLDERNEMLLKLCNIALSATIAWLQH